MRMIEQKANNFMFFLQWYTSETPEADDPPGRYKKLGAFSRLCLIRVFRTDRVPAGISEFIFASMGQTFVTPPITVLDEVLVSTTPVIPIILIVQPGSDPPAALTALANAVDFSVSKIKYLSLGQGQEPVSSINQFLLVLCHRLNLHAILLMLLKQRP